MKHKIIALLAISIILAGCGVFQKSTDGVSYITDGVFKTSLKQLNFNISSNKTINLNHKNNPMSVAVVFYQLKDRRLFDGASYEDLVNKDKETLEGELIASYNFIVRPNKKMNLTVETVDKPAYIGVVAFFNTRDEETKWKFVIPAKSLSRYSATNIEIIDNKIQLEKQKKKKYQKQKK